MTLDNLVVRYCDAIVREQEKWNKNKVSCETTENGIELDVDQYSIDEGRQLICMIKKRFIAEIFKYIVNSLYNELEREKPNVVDSYLQECRTTLVITQNKSRRELINLDKEFMGVSLLHHHTNYFAKCYSNIWKRSDELPFDDVKQLTVIIKDRVEALLPNVKKFCISYLYLFQLGFTCQEDLNATTPVTVCK